MVRIFECHLTKKCHVTKNALIQFLQFIVTQTCNISRNYLWNQSEDKNNTWRNQLQSKTMTLKLQILRSQQPMRIPVWESMILL